MRKQLMRLEQGDHVQQLLEYYMGKNTPVRQEFIIDNLRIESDKPLETEFDK
jgi:topoisomerase-4 subunit B